jgi:tRNA/tmRNA/rRNA uracil-C5-methylase (TrmA/RlmC/RlmD family)
MSDERDIVERLRERRQLRFIADCKCGKCQLVHIDDVYAASDEIERLRTALRSVRASTDPRWQAQIISDALREKT